MPGPWSTRGQLSFLVQSVSGEPRPGPRLDLDSRGDLQEQVQDSDAQGRAESGGLGLL